MSNKTIFWWLTLSLLVSLAPACQGARETVPSKDTPKVNPPDAANATYSIDRQSITLSNGSAEQSIVPGSASKMFVKLADQQATGDVNGDDKPDIVVVLIHSSGGSGTFYWVAAVLNDGAVKGTSTNVELLGDRIALEKVSIDRGEIIVDYLMRRSGEPLATPPSVKTTKRFSVKDGKLAASQ